jgi:hypothetical protein
MDLLIFDMDGVLVKPRGYHKALKETVRLAGVAVGFGEAELTDEQISRFEALGISSEWHSSALCMAYMQGLIQKPGAGSTEPFQVLDLETLFEALAAQPMQYSALQRGEMAIKWLAAGNGFQAHQTVRLITESESIQSSPTLNWFQELILGSENFKDIYQKEPQFSIRSYLEQHDLPLIGKQAAQRVLDLAEKPDYGAVVMTNRPSLGPFCSSGMPDATLGSRLVRLESMPVVGKGEILWLADQTGLSVEEIAKPSWRHAMISILVAGGNRVDDGLHYIWKRKADWDHLPLEYLSGSRITVFEDTPGGLVSVQEATKLMNDAGITVEVQLIGIADGGAKHLTLEAQGAAVFPDINQALASLDYF